MNCIKCDGKLESIEIENVQVEQCQDCFGIWFDFGELEKILTREKIDTLKNTAFKNEQFDQKRAVCPKCGGEAYMTKTIKNNVTIDTCRICFGQWLDGGEIEQIRKTHGGADLSFVFSAIC